MDSGCRSGSKLPLVLFAVCWVERGSVVDFSVYGVDELGVVADLAVDGAGFEGAGVFPA